MKLFRRNKIDIETISVPDFGWELGRKEKTYKQWLNPEHPMGLSVNFFTQKPDIPSTRDVDLLRFFYRGMAVQANGGILEVDLLEVQGIAGVKTIIKIPQEPNGMNYLASITLPFKNYSYVVKLEAPEMGTTGMRDAVVGAKLMKEGIVNLEDKGLDGWFADPYEPNIKEGTPMNKAEDPQYDAEFPEHPLSLLRKYFRELEAGISFDPKIQQVKSFEN